MKLYVPLLTAGLLAACGTDPSQWLYQTILKPSAKKAVPSVPDRSEKSCTTAEAASESLLWTFLDTSSYQACNTDADCAPEPISTKMCNQVAVDRTAFDEYQQYQASPQEAAIWQGLDCAWNCPAEYTGSVSCEANVCTFSPSWN